MSEQNKIFSIHTSIVNTCVKIHESLGFFLEKECARGMSSSTSLTHRTHTCLVICTFKSFLVCFQTRCFLHIPLAGWEKQLYSFKTFLLANLKIKILTILFMPSKAKTEDVF